MCDQPMSLKLTSVMRGFQIEPQRLCPVTKINKPENIKGSVQGKFAYRYSHSLNRNK